MKITKNIKNQRFLEPFPILKDIQIIDLALYLTKYKTLILADTHIGYEEALNKQGILIPRLQFKDLIKKLEKILSKVKSGTHAKRDSTLQTIIINGDIKHEFGKISDQEWRHTLRLIDFLKKHCKNVILIKGNHDKSLGPIANKRKVITADSIILDNILITHGNKLLEIPKQIKTIIIGHEHPAVTLKDNSRKEKFKCFLKGKFKNKVLIVQPSLNLITEGTDVTNEKLISPFLKQNLKNFEAFIVADKVYAGVKLKHLNY